MIFTLTEAAPKKEKNGKSKKGKEYKGKKEKKDGSKSKDMEIGCHMVWSQYIVLP